MQAAAGLVLFVLGVVAMAGWIPALREVTYPVCWWGLLMMADAHNFRRAGQSLWRGSYRRFFGVTLPVSVLLWLFFELLNLPAPEWIYAGGFHSIRAQTLLGFASFSTVIPIEIESWWLVGGKLCIPAPLRSAALRFRTIFVLLGIATVVLPWFNQRVWYLNQAMWLSPALLLLPFLKWPACADSGLWLARLSASGLLAGLFWECLNWFSPAHWKYLILRGAPHLFQMPIPGYLGFIPFAVTCLAVYEAVRRIRSSVIVIALLWISAAGLMFALTQVYFDRGIWRP